MFPAIIGIDGSKAGMLEDNGKNVLSDVKIAGDAINEESFKGLKEQADWWNANKQFAEVDTKPVADATLHGSRMALRVTALVPATMAVLYLILLALFKAPKEEHGGHVETTVSDSAE